MAMTRSSTRSQAIAWFDLDGVGRSPSRFDFAKLNNLNGHYLRAADNGRLVAMVTPRIEEKLGSALSPAGLARLAAGMDGLKARAETLVQLAESALFYLRARPIPIDEKAAKQLNPEARQLLAALAGELDGVAWEPPALEAVVRSFAEKRGVKLGQVAQPFFSKFRVPRMSELNSIHSPKPTT